MGLKKIVKEILAHLACLPYQYGWCNTGIRVMSIDETIEELLNTEKSMVRFGDGEMTMMMGKSLQLEEHQTELADSMRRIISYEQEGLMVAICSIFGDLKDYRKESRKFWKDHLLVRRREYVKLCSGEKIYGNATISRCYYMYWDKSKCERQFGQIRQIWKGKKVVVVEGAATHNGVGNDLLDTALTVERIIGPSKNAFLRLDEIRNACLTFPKDRLFLISLGAAAKPLTESLFHSGYRALDIGNLDKEYEWYLMQAEGKVKLRKHQIIGKEANQQAGYEEYLEQIKVYLES